MNDAVLECCMQCRTLQVILPSDIFLRFVVFEKQHRLNIVQWLQVCLEDYQNVCYTRAVSISLDFWLPVWIMSEPLFSGTGNEIGKKINQIL